MVDLQYIVASDIWLLRVTGDTSLRQIRRSVLQLQKQTDPTRNTYQLIVLKYARFTFSALQVERVKELIARGLAATGWYAKAYVALLPGNDPLTVGYARVYRRLVKAPGYHVKVFSSGAEAVRWLRVFQT
jgi:hypothetical protein